MQKIHKRSDCIVANGVSSYCPGCLHGVAHNLIGESIDELGLRDKSVAVMPVGCSTLGLFYFDVDTIGSAHGRAPAVATGMKRMSPQSLIFTYQGDGDLASIGMAEIMHAANRGENFTTFFINNSIYGMTGGQMAPTTLLGQKSTTSPKGREKSEHGAPMKMCELISALEAPVYVARFALNTPQNIMKAKKGIKRALEIQASGKGYAFVELLTNCPTNWGMSALDSIQWMNDYTLKEFPLGVYKDTAEEGEVHGE